MNPQTYTSPVAQKAPGMDKKIILIIIGLFFALLVGAALMIASKGTDTSELLARSVLRQEAMIQLTKDAKKNIRSGQLQKVNSDASLFLISDLTILQALMQGTGLKSAPKDIAVSEVDAASTERLTDASRDGRYDEVYVSIMNQKIDAQQALLREISSNTNNPADKQGLKTVYAKLENIQKQLSEL